MKFVELLTSSPGTCHVYRYDNIPLREEAVKLLHVYCNRKKAKVKLQRVNGFGTTDHKAWYFLHVEVIESSEPKQKVLPKKLTR